MTESQQKVVSAGLAVFARYGYRQTTMELLAEEARLSRQGLYRHFPNKESVFAAAIEWLHEGALDAAETAGNEAVEAGQPTADVLRTQVLTRSEFIFLRLRGTAHGEELAEENMRLCSHIALLYAERFAARLAHRIRSEIRKGKYKVSSGLTPERLAGYLISAARGVKTGSPSITIEELRGGLVELLTLIVRGADARMTQAVAKATAAPVRQRLRVAR